MPRAVDRRSGRHREQVLEGGALGLGDGRVGGDDDRHADTHHGAVAGAQQGPEHHRRSGGREVPLVHRRVRPASSATPARTRYVVVGVSGWALAQLVAAGGSTPLVVAAGRGDRDRRERAVRDRHGQVLAEGHGPGAGGGVGADRLRAGPWWWGRPGDPSTRRSRPSTGRPRGRIPGGRTGRQGLVAPHQCAPFGFAEHLARRIRRGAPVDPIRWPGTLGSARAGSDSLRRMGAAAIRGAGGAIATPPKRERLSPSVRQQRLLDAAALIIETEGTRRPSRWSGWAR